MNCKICKTEVKMIEIHGIRGNYCCGEFQTCLDSLRPRVREGIEEDDKKVKEFWIMLEEAISSVE